MRRDLAPEYRAEDIRILETRDGIAKSDHAAFKAAIRLTKSDIPGACRAFEGLQDAHPASVSLLFNIGLCREGAGDLAAAARIYRGVLDLKRNKTEAVDGLARIALRLRAEQQRALR